MDTIVKASWKLLVKLFIPIFLLCLLIAVGQFANIKYEDYPVVKFLVGVYAFLTGLLYVGVVTHLVGKRFSVYKEQSSFTFKKYLRLIGTALLLFLALLVSAIPAGIAFYFTGFVSEEELSALTITFGITGVLLCLIPCYLLIRWICLYPSVVIGNKSVIESFEKSWNLTKGNFCCVLGVVLVVFITIYIALLLLAALVFLVFSLIGLTHLVPESFMQHPVATMSGIVLLAALYGALFAPTIISHALIYTYFDKPESKEELKQL